MSTKRPNTYKSLFQKVKQTLILGQQRIEEEKVKIYWETGNLIQSHIKQNKDRAEYGTEVVKRLSRDLGVEISTLHRCVRFAQTYPRLKIVGGRPQFSWTHYRKLITVTDGRKRDMLEQRVIEHAWSADELAVQIKSGHGKRPVALRDSREKSTDQQKLLAPQCGKLYTYQIIRRPELGEQGQASDLLLDLGFGMYKRVSPRLQGRFIADQIIESTYDDKEETYALRTSERTAKDLFTYQAVIEKVIDADTLKVRIDLGFDLEHRETLRMRDIDAPEVGTKEGDTARNFMRSLLKEASLIVLRSSRSDKYDRYLADVFIPQADEPDPATDVYLNNLLLQEGHAWRV